MSASKQSKPSKTSKSSSKASVNPNNKFQSEAMNKAFAVHKCSEKACKKEIKGLDSFKTRKSNLTKMFLSKKLDSNQFLAELKNLTNEMEKSPEFKEKIKCIISQCSPQAKAAFTELAKEYEQVCKTGEETIAVPNKSSACRKAKDAKPLLKKPLSTVSYMQQFDLVRRK